MTHARNPKKRRPARSRTRRNAIVGWPTIALLLAVGIGVAIFTTRGSGGDADSRGAAVLARTGEINAMGVPVVETPGSGTGLASASGVEVRGALYDLGTVPLLVAVRPQWTVVNTSDEPIELGEPTPEVLQGCCPGPFTVGASRLAPGASTTLTFELSMHPGMDGWHDIVVHVPIWTANGDDVLDLRVVGDFRGEYLG